MARGRKVDAAALAEIRRTLLAWFDRACRDLPWRRTNDPYAIWVSEVMLQQTRVATVIPYYERFLAALPDIRALAAADEDTLHRLWQGLGYYRRVALLRRGAREVVERFGGTLPRTLADLRSIPGLGAYTAGAVGSIAFGLPVSAVDGNVIRVFARWLDDKRSLEDIRTYLQSGEADRWVDPERPGDWNQALMELGATICTPRAPRCDECPVAGFCRAREKGTQLLRPAKAKAARHVELAVTVLVFREGNRVWLERRPAQGLLAGLWGFPVVENEGKSDGESEGEGREVLRYTHVFTHRTWKASVREVSAPPPRDAQGKWVPLPELSDEPIPTAFQPVVRFLCEPRLL